MRAELVSVVTSCIRPAAPGLPVAKSPSWRGCADCATGSRGAPSAYFWACFCWSGRGAGLETGERPSWRSAPLLLPPARGAAALWCCGTAAAACEGPASSPVVWRRCSLPPVLAVWRGAAASAAAGAECCPSTPVTVLRCCASPSALLPPPCARLWVALASRARRRMSADGDAASADASFNVTPFCRVFFRSGVCASFSGRMFGSCATSHCWGIHFADSWA